MTCHPELLRRTDPPLSQHDIRTGNIDTVSSYNDDSSDDGSAIPQPVIDAVVVPLAPEDQVGE
jgi:hypothetical protein